MKFDDLYTDPTVKTFAVCDARCFAADSFKECCECLYVKMVELTNVLISKGADPENMKAIVSETIGSMFDSNGILGPYHARHEETDRALVGWVNRRWKMYSDKNV